MPARAAVKRAAKPKAPPKVSPLEVRFARQLLEAGLAWDGWDVTWCDAVGAPLERTRTDFLFRLSRGRWRAVAVEIEGGGYVRGRHHREPGYSQDCGKYNRMGLAGVLLLRGTETLLRDETLLGCVRLALVGRKSSRADLARCRKQLDLKESQLEARAVYDKARAAEARAKRKGAAGD